MKLDVTHFADFFADVNTPSGQKPRTPFPWQRRLVEKVATEGRWPDLLDLPTGTGKTSVLDAAVFLLALRDDQPRRVVFVVDRRIVVHQAARHARTIRDRLRNPSSDVVHEVARRLSDRAHAGGDSAPLELAELRGGIERDDDWARRPDVPTIVVSTVDQVGSRLLFRGYGVSSGMRPVHAGLLGNDALLFLDEVHLARPFAQTVGAIGQRYRPSPEAGLPDRWKVVELSATPESAARPSTFRLGRDDRDPLLTPVLARRLRASKPVRRLLVPVSGKDEGRHHEALAAAAVREAAAMFERDGIATVGVVVNRVDTAVRIHRLWQDPTRPESVLLTGRMRPLERDRLTDQYGPRIFTGRVRSDAVPLLLVATQAIEAGADLDLDALVTECAPLDALIQRFGRVDRVGHLSEAGLATTSVVLAASASVAPGAIDPIYGDRLERTWQWLGGSDRDFGVDALEVDPLRRADLSSPSVSAPALLPSHLDRWVQTSQRPHADPDPAHWLHGLRESSAQVNVVWRADLTRELLAVDDPDAGTRALTLVSVCPPGSGEAVQVPLAAVRQWLTRLGGHADDERTVGIADTVSDLPEHGQKERTLAPVLVWSGDQSKVARLDTHIVPGSTVVAPSSYGGLRDANWDADATDPVTDLGAQAQAVQRGRLVLRMHPDLLPPEIGPPPIPDRTDEASTTAVRRRLHEWWEDAARVLRPGVLNNLDPILPDVVDSFRSARSQFRLYAIDLDNVDPPHQMFVLSGRRKGTVRVADSEPDTSAFTGDPLRLDVHLDDVQTWAVGMAARCGLPPPLAKDLGLAAALHDLGKVDPRFQLWLRDGTVTVEDEPLAKSATPSTDFRARRRAQIAAGYPLRTRHELASVALAASDPDLRQDAHDWDLVLHLIASHHGYARPFMPVPAPDPAPAELRARYLDRTLTCLSNHDLTRLDSGVPARFWRCVRRYGWFGLAWLEAILRLADHRASEQRIGTDS